MNERDEVETDEVETDEVELLENDHGEGDILPDPIEVAPDESEAAEPIDMSDRVVGRRNPDLPTEG